VNASKCGASGEGPPGKRPAEEYRGVEQGPIRPPSEAESLLLRVTRNCPWNKCEFCPVYKGARFSRRPLEHVLADIDAIAAFIRRFQRVASESGRISQADLRREFADLGDDDTAAFSVAWNWYARGMRSVFLQDANSLIMKPADLVRVLGRLREHFPDIERITTYARSQTITKISDVEMRELAFAGLNRIHVGFESGSDTVLALVKKGATKAQHIEAGRRVVRAGIELSAYYMPGLGGVELWPENARETADLMNQVNPHFIRLRSLAIPDQVPLAERVRLGSFTKAGDVTVAREVLLFIESLEGITSTVKSDHILNLFQDLEGSLPVDKERLLAIPRAFLALSPEQQRLYQIGRRHGLFAGPADMDDPERVEYAERLSRRLAVSEDNVDDIVDRLTQQFI